MQKNFLVDSGSTDTALSQSLEYIHENLAALNLNHKDINRAELMCEESLVSLLQHSDFTKVQAFTVNVSKFFGNVNIKLTVLGQEFAFTVGFGDVMPLDSDDISLEAAETIRNILLRSFSQNLSYRHSGNYNTIKIRAVRSSYSGLYAVLGALVCAVICDLLMRAFVPESVYMFVNDNLFVSVRNVFLNGLKLCAIPVVFFSITSCMSDSGGLSGLRHIGGKILACFMMTQVVALVIAFGLMLAFRVGEGAGLTAGVSSVNAQAASISLLDTFVNVIPSDIVRPFFDGNMLQLIALAVILGLSAGLSGAKSLANIFTELNATFTKAMSIFLKIIPLVVFCSIASMILTTGMKTLLSVLGVTLTIAAGDILLFVLYWLMVKFLAHLNPAVMYKKSLPALLTAASTCSSTASLPDAMKCTKNMGIPSYVYSFTLPLGITISRNIAVIYVAVGVMFTANIYGRVLTFGDMAFLGISTLIIVLGAANVAVGAAVVMSVILLQMGLPVESVPLFMIIDVVNDMLDTATACIGPIASALVVSAREGILDMKEYNRP
ncbi:MAG: dicarboxylate/amino acid:cation symporter [Synergistaceae bacterium]|nr:dicarboxylate/amino acid:cation symporter [Synergistaceae bacterium]